VVPASSAACCDRRIGPLPGGQELLGQPKDVGIVRTTQTAIPGDDDQMWRSIAGGSKERVAARTGNARQTPQNGGKPI
jgi:hypothetical protein